MEETNSNESCSSNNTDYGLQVSPQSEEIHESRVNTEKGSEWLRTDGINCPNFVKKDTPRYGVVESNIEDSNEYDPVVNPAIIDKYLAPLRQNTSSGLRSKHTIVKKVSSSTSKKNVSLLPEVSTPATNRVETLIEKLRRAIQARKERFNLAESSISIAGTTTGSVSTTVSNRNRQTLAALKEFKEYMEAQMNKRKVSKPSFQKTVDSNTVGDLKGSAHIDQSLIDRKQKSLEVLRALKKSIEAQRLHRDGSFSVQALKSTKQDNLLADLVRKPMLKMDKKQKTVEILKTLKKMVEAGAFQSCLQKSSSLEQEDSETSTDSESDAESVVTAVNLVIRRKMATYPASIIRRSHTYSRKNTAPTNKLLNSNDENTELVSTMVNTEIVQIESSVSKPKSFEGDSLAEDTDTETDSDKESVVTVRYVVRNIAEDDTNITKSILEDEESVSDSDNESVISVRYVPSASPEETTKSTHVDEDSESDSDKESFITARLLPSACPKKTTNSIHENEDSESDSDNELFLTARLAPSACYDETTKSIQEDEDNESDSDEESVITVRHLASTSAKMTTKSIPENENSESDSDKDSVITVRHLAPTIAAETTNTIHEDEESDKKTIRTFNGEEVHLEVLKASQSDFFDDSPDSVSTDSESDTESIVSVIDAFVRQKQLEELRLKNSGQNVTSNQFDLAKEQQLRRAPTNFFARKGSTYSQFSKDVKIPFNFLNQYLKDFDNCLEKAAVHVKYGKSPVCTCENSKEKTEFCIKHIEPNNLEFFENSAKIIQTYLKTPVDEKEYFLAEWFIRNHCPKHFKNRIMKLPIYLTEDFRFKNNESRRQVVKTFDRILKEEDLLLEYVGCEVIIGEKRNITTTGTDEDFSLAIDFLMKEYPALFVHLIEKYEFLQLSQELSLVDANRKAIIEKSKLSEEDLQGLEEDDF